MSSIGNRIGSPRFRGRFLGAFRHSYLECRAACDPEKDQADWALLLQVRGGGPSASPQSLEASEFWLCVCGRLLGLDRGADRLGPGAVGTTAAASRCGWRGHQEPDYSPRLLIGVEAIQGLNLLWSRLSRLPEWRDEVQYPTVGCGCICWWAGDLSHPK